MEKIINRYDLTYIGSDGDYGDKYEFNCPECGYLMVISDHDLSKTECDCGYQWELNVSVLGNKENDN